MQEPIILPVGPIAANCYIVPGEGGGCAVVDPGGEAARIRRLLEEQGLTPKIILLTHGHFDHTGAVKELQEWYSCPLAVGAEDEELLENPPLSLGQGDRFCMKADRLLREGDTVECAGLSFTVLETPGHTRGGVCYLCSGVLYSGDTLFRGDCGRTDLYGGDWDTLRRSLRRLAELPDETRVYPGHGPLSDMGTEKRTNPTLSDPAV